jgi:hypothetical protein
LNSLLFSAFHFSISFFVQSVDLIRLNVHYYRQAGYSFCNGCKKKINLFIFNAFNFRKIFFYLKNSFPFNSPEAVPQRHTVHSTQYSSFTSKYKLTLCIVAALIIFNVIKHVKKRQKHYCCNLCTNYKNKGNHTIWNEAATCIK